MEIRSVNLLVRKSRGTGPGINAEWRSGNEVETYGNMDTKPEPSVGLDFVSEERPDLRSVKGLDFRSIKSIEDLDAVSGGVVWQNFEKLAAFIFEENGYQVKINIVKVFHRMRRQYDVIAKKSGETFLVECKKWSGNRYRLSSLKTAIKQHKDRTDFYTTVTGERAIPLIITLIEEEIHFYEEVPIIPILKLNSFIIETDRGEISAFQEDYPDECGEYWDDVECKESAECGRRRTMGDEMDWAGTWDTNCGKVELWQIGEFVTGAYSLNQGRIKGRVSGLDPYGCLVLTGEWSVAPTYALPDDAGGFEIHMDYSGKSFKGRFWKIWPSSGHVWSGERASTSWQ